ncbi:MAG: radical SAM protein [Verrucomicrobiota bacterium]
MQSHGYLPNETDLEARGIRQVELHAAAAQARQAVFGRNVFVRAVVEISNFCRENCAYCGMRRDNRTLHRFRARHEQIAELLVHHLPPSVTDVNIQSGEDPLVVREVVLPLLETLRRDTSLGVSLCLGTLTPQLYDALQEAGAALYIMKFEAGDARRYNALHAPGSLPERLRHIRMLAARGWFVSSGVIAGLPGQTTRNLAADLQLADSLPLHGCSLSPFIPGDATPLASATAAPSGWTFNGIAALRLMRSQWVIPAVSALNLVEGDGYRRGLRAGANLVTINLTPDGMREDYIIYKRERFIMTEERVLAAIEAEGLTPSRQGLADYYRNGMASPTTTERAPVTG